MNCPTMGTRERHLSERMSLLGSCNVPAMPRRKLQQHPRNAKQSAIGYRFAGKKGKAVNTSLA